MNTALWIVGLSALLLSAGGYGLGRAVEGWGDGALGIGVLIWAAYALAALLSLAWVVLLIVKVCR